ncbi:MAG: ABC transporter ATP-binding protein [Candidatus Latescibacteria bacterium]|nr:ABC transporter ATP-binding protein [Candidatus Latescibacterota bacterium]
MNTSIALTVSDVHQSFTRGEHNIDVLHAVSLSAAVGESLALVGPSGSGKSTLLHLLGTLEKPTAGQIAIGGQDPNTLSEPELARFRNEQIGFIFQSHHLLPQYSALDNTLVPSLAFPQESRAGRARDLLTAVGLAQRLEHRPAELSGGECQRVAVARALINRPGLLLCDEPTGSLDRQTATTVADLLFTLHRSEDTVLVIATHDPELAERCDRRFALREGTCVEV